MNEQEAIEKIWKDICNEKPTQRYCRDSCMHGREYCAYSMAIKALEEMAKIKEMGDCYIIPKNGVWEVNGIDVHKALEKQIAKKPIEIKGLIFSLTKDGSEAHEIICECPNCRSRKLKRGFPCKCGQRIDWE